MSESDWTPERLARDLDELVRRLRVREPGRCKCAHCEKLRAALEIRGETADHVLERARRREFKKS